MKLTTSSLPALRRFAFLRLVAVLTLLLFGANLVESAAPPAGTSIGNQASATYTDSGNTPRTATSNVAITIVQQVASFTLVTDGQTKFGSPGGQVYYTHTLRNTGNGPDTFSLSVVNAPGGDTFDLNSLTLYADANSDGLPDNSTPISTTGPLPAGATFQFVAVGIVPGAATAGQTALIRILASGTATASPAPQQTNSNTTTVSSDAVVAVNKSISSSSGPPGSGPYTITLTYNNTGNNTASNLTLLDILPVGMNYVTNTARWSVTGATPLTDATGDTEGTAPDTIRYDFGQTAAGRVTAVITRVLPGQAGTVTFQVNVAASATAGTLNNTATYSYDPFPGGTPVGPFTGNTVQFNVTVNASLTFTGQTIPSAPQGSIVPFTNVVQNTGNSTDTFDITVTNVSFPAGSTFTLYQPDGNTPLVDSTANGIADTGPLSPGQSYNVVIKVILPPGASGTNVNYTVQKTATSRNNPTVSATATDVLATVTAGRVDLSAGPAGGAGPGPEVAPAVVNNADPATTTRFTLYVTNLSTIGDTFNLAASTDSGFGSFTLPAGWTVTFRDTSEAIVTATGVIPAGGFQVVYADVAVPAGNVPGLVDLYFRALSPSSSLIDRLHVGVSVNTVRGLALSLTHNGQVSPGGTVVYPHLLANNGNVLEGDGTNSSVNLTVTDNLAGSGWSSVIYYDANNNGIVDGGDTLVTNLAFVSAGGFGLAPGESVRLVVKVSAPPGVAAGVIDVTTLTATTVNVGLATPVPAPVNAADNTTVIAGDLILVKEQALDANNDGVPDGPYSTADISSGATPGTSIRYRIIVTNTGTAPASQVRVFDTTPVFTVYTTNGPAVTTLGTVPTVPTPGTAGGLVFDIGTLAPGQSATNTFGVTIQQ